MKKFTTILCMAALLINMAALTGCNSNEEGSDIPGGSSAVVDSSDNSGSSDSSDGSDGSDSSENPDSSESDPEPQKPDGEPTFLTAPDGTPIYTSEISEVYTGSEQDGDKKTITFAEAEQLAQTGEGDFTVKCDGFVYGFTSERALNHVDNPEMFKDLGDGKYFEFLGEDFDTYTFEGKYFTDYTRIKVGDRFGSLTVKNAYTLFEDKPWNPEDDFSDVPGVYISDCCVEFDGEIELTGYVDVTRMETLYGTGGDMKFYPDGDSSVIIPNFGFILNKKARCVCHFPYASGIGYCGTYYDIGNMYKVDCDTSGLQPGDSFVKVKVVLDNVKFLPGFQEGGWKFDLKSIEVL